MDLEKLKQYQFVRAFINGQISFEAFCDDFSTFIEREPSFCKSIGVKKPENSKESYSLFIEVRAELLAILEKVTNLKIKETNKTIELRLTDVIAAIVLT